MELCMNPKSTAARRYISYFMHHINLLRHYKVVPVVVFDGGSMPCKAATDNERRRYRELSYDGICLLVTNAKFHFL
jgi:exonuclease-1